MTATVKLSAIIDAIDTAMDEWSAYLDKRTGEVHSLPQEAFDRAEEDPDDEPSRQCAEWERDETDLARDILDNDDQYLVLPSKFDIHEWEIMNEFSLRYRDDAISNELGRVIRGSGAFRYFKDTIHRLGIVDEWYRFRDETLRQIAVDWCEENGLTYTED
jgi:hypothetical protein